MNKLKDKLWKQGKPASEYPKDWIVIPVLDVIEILNIPTKKEYREDEHIAGIL